MKVLFLYNNDMEFANGGGRITKRNLYFCSKMAEVQSLRITRKEYCKNMNHVFRKFLNKFITFFMNFFLRAGGLSISIERNIMKLLKDNKYDYVFVDSSIYGRLVKKISKSNKTIVFFHNFEYKYYKDQISLKNPSAFLLFLSVLFNERLSCKYAELCLFITDKDRQDAENQYGIELKNYDIFPASFFDACVDTNFDTNGEYLLFVGSNFYANLNGIIWFIENILPNINKKLLVIGSGMKNALHKYELLYSNNSKLEVLDFVDDLRPYYLNSICVLAPLFLGSGMKVKVAEAFMYGNFVIGTDLAFEGYIIDNKVLSICNTATQFIKKINDLNQKEIDHKYIHQYFLNNYETENQVKKIQERLKTI